MHKLLLLACTVPITLAWSPATAADPSPVLSVSGERFLVDGRTVDLWGIRVGSATMDDAICRHLIDQLDDYRDHGLNALTVFYMGCSGGYHDPFSPDGLTIDPAHQRRMHTIIRAAADRRMIVVVGIFYQRVKTSLRDDDAVRNAVRTVTENLKPHRNIIINIANEQNSPRYQGVLKPLNDPQTVIDLCRIVRQVDPARLVGGGGYNHPNNEIIGRSPHVDVLLFDTAGPNPGSDELYKRFRAAGVLHKPIVNVETFGGWTANFPTGVFPEDLRSAYRREVDAAAARPGLSVFLHNNPWLQGSPMRYDLAGLGTPDDPGIRWYFQYVKSKQTTQ